ncbi:hypothetical protein N7466_006317 [Penicillium verhagenii]|uniref:uncharacterized protein n=1 Tax=Penicillium verhagenii TaxID=1562060 RepID=UPI00254558BE|nr:uncharacterized protein N7466_006317 [Penicillium verhagenii]KAJ5930824.1 hypothetical protein N7466_006317 [Penicillium verhagenii]
MPSADFTSSTTVVKQVPSARKNLESLLPALWNLPQDKYAPEPSDALLDYYYGQLVFIECYQLKLHKNEELIDFTGFIKAKVNYTRPELIQAVETTYVHLGPAIRAIEVAVKLWLFLSIEDWDDKQTLEQYIQSIFRKSSGPSEAPSFLLTFNIDNLRKVGGFQISWTERLEDHLSLSLEDEHKELKIFHLSSFLDLYRHSNDRPILPSGFLEETARTLSLLIPSSNLKCQRWIRKAHRKSVIDLEMGQLPATSRDVADFTFWGRQLLELRNEYDRTEPTTLRQWILDKRKPNQRYTFWIAVIALFLGLLFGLIQSVTGIIQAMH